LSERVQAYAAALLEVARAEEQLEKVADELFRFARALEDSEELRGTLTDEALPPEKRQAIVEDILGRRASPVTASLISFVVGVGRARELVAIIDKVVEQAAAEAKREVAEVRSSMPLDDEQRERLAEALSKSLGKQVEVKVVVDPSVLGGVVARVGDTVLDGTVRHRLEQLRERL
jgi:F-type H+-transporting ATPase subunit delta